MFYKGCSHLQEAMAKGDVLRDYQLINSWFVNCVSAEARLKKALTCVCHVCHTYGPRLHACLSCIYFGCMKPKHIHKHASERNHPLALDLTHGYVYCFECGDYTYNWTLRKICRRNKVLAAKSLGIPADNSWEPCPEEIELLKYHTDRRKVTSNSTIGLRGMINLGNTCFMSTILQALTHTPMLRDYFLGDKHLCLAPDPDRCLACQINSLFQQLYGGQRTALAPTRLLHMIWTSAKHLAGYEQQDAHEFFMAILDLLHQQMKPFQRDRTPQEGGGGGGGSAGCRCIIDTIFTGGLQSDVVCLSCNNVSTTIDPFWDISLDLAPLELNQSTPTTLEDCLEQFTRQEHLGSSAKIKCVSCDSYQESTKQLTMKELPIVASFHLKRFEHTSRLRKKISTVVRFPEELDMTPYLSRCRNNNNFRQERVFNNNLYSLYAVVNHIGTLEAGHYIVYIRQHRDNWFKCDDHIITRATLRDVLNSEGYLLFYHKHRLEYSYE
ncbi:ubiquitin carboxyl-terminal hydrolase 22-like [Amphibalanus amphitrite]|uniref:ubiquitin carboxyl-terminal hydrolase 22-like n=1 Tax=Amphibalanus amphitrite TaxID=1232801 RepID=UPI001C923A8B|nr:ubiquitin carboxyl-terminal hydrolase 22-like [Amphibalanus amphitrite]